MMIFLSGLKSIIPLPIMLKKKPKHPETEAIRQQLARTPYREYSSPIFMTSSFVFVFR